MLKGGSSVINNEQTLMPLKSNINFQVSSLTLNKERIQLYFYVNSRQESCGQFNLLMH